MRHASPLAQSFQCSFLLDHPCSPPAQAQTATEHSGLLALPGDLLAFRDRNTFQQYGQARLLSLNGLQARVDAVPSGVKPNDLVVSTTWSPALIVSTTRLLCCIMLSLVSGLMLWISGLCEYRSASNMHKTLMRQVAHTSIRATHHACAHAGNQQHIP
jgi:hypothetical protein